MFFLQSGPHVSASLPDPLRLEALGDHALDVSDQLMGLYGPEQLREVERLSTYNYRARLAGGEIVLAVVRGDGSLVLIEPEMDG